MLHVFKVTDELLTVDNARAKISSTRGKTYYVDANSGVDTRTGRSWSKALKTMSAAFAKIASGDTIEFTGNITEQLTTPVFVSDVTIIGSGNRPHHADSHPPGANTACNSWRAPSSPVATTALIKIIEPGWSLKNILFVPPTDAEAVLLYRDAGADPVEKNASHATIQGCRFAGGLNGIGSSGQPFNVGIYDNVFQDATGFAIYHSTIVADAGVANPLQWEIARNKFVGNANHVALEASKFWIYDNFFDDGGTPNTTKVLNLGTTGGNNFIVRNLFQTATANFNTPDVVGYATDVWMQNYSIDSTATGVGANFEAGQPA